MSRRNDIPENVMIERLKALHARDGGMATEEASFTCPVCGIRPILFEGNRKCNDGQPVVECFCLAPFSPRAEIESSRVEAGGSFWDYPMLRNAEVWGQFVAWKLELPTEEEDEEEEQ